MIILSYSFSKVFTRLIKWTRRPVELTWVECCARIELFLVSGKIACALWPFKAIDFCTNGKSTYGFLLAISCDLSSLARSPRYLSTRRKSKIAQPWFDFPNPRTRFEFRRQNLPRTLKVESLRYIQWKITLVYPTFSRLITIQLHSRHRRQKDRQTDCNHNHELPNRTYVVKDCNFLIRLLYDC